MTDDFHLFASDDDAEPIHPDDALLSAYLARELSPLQVIAVEERLIADGELRARMQPLLDAWAAPLPSLEGGRAHRVAPPTTAEVADGWHRFQQEGSIHTLTPHRRMSMPRIAAMIALFVLPMLTLAQGARYAATHPDAPGHRLARRLVAPFLTMTAPGSGAPAPLIEHPNDVALGEILLPAPRPHQQESVPVAELSPPSAKTTQTIAALLGMKELSSGRLLVDDGGRRLLHLFEPNLATSTVALDSAFGVPNSYGAWPWPLIPYRGDSSLIFDDRTRRSMLVLDERGKVARTIALFDRESYLPRARFADPRGRTYTKSGGSGRARVVYVPATSIFLPPGAAPHVDGPNGTRRAFVSERPDTVPIIRLDPERRSVDTLAYLMDPLNETTGLLPNGGGRMVVAQGKNGEVTGIKQVINPLYAIDEWAVLSDGTVAVVRGHDYHVDWIHPDGTRSSSPKLPYEWKRLTDEDKQRLIDSTRRVVDSLDAVAAANYVTRRAQPAAVADSGSPRGGAGPAAAGDGVKVPRFRFYPYEVVPPSQIADYWPPIRQGAALPDRDGNLWILPAVTALSRKGELVYDVVHPRAGLVRRVRLPAGRSIAGFGRGGVVYLQFGDVRSGFILERTTIAGTSVSTPGTR